MLGGPQGRCGPIRKISPPPGFDPVTVQPITSRYTDYVIPSHFQWEIQDYIWPKTVRITEGPPNFYFSDGDICSLTQRTDVAFPRQQWLRKRPTTLRNICIAHLVFSLSMHHVSRSQWPLAFWDCGFESRWGYGSLYLVNVVCCQVEFSASG